MVLHKIKLLAQFNEFIRNMIRPDWQSILRQAFAVLR